MENEPLFVKRGDGWIVNPIILFYWKTTHGLPPQITEEIIIKEVKEILKKKNAKKIKE